MTKGLKATPQVVNDYLKLFVTGEHIPSNPCARTQGAGRQRRGRSSQCG